MFMEQFEVACPALLTRRTLAVRYVRSWPIAARAAASGQKMQSVGLRLAPPEQLLR